MSPDEARDWLNLMRGILEDRAIGDLETSYDESSTDSFPTPMTAHPALSHAAEFVRSHNRPSVLIPGISRHTWAESLEETYPTSLISPTPLVLNARKMTGPVPFVGDPLYERVWYVWHVWSDNHGRHISGDTRPIVQRRHHPDAAWMSD